MLEEAVGLMRALGNGDLHPTAAATTPWRTPASTPSGPAAEGLSVASGRKRSTWRCGSATGFITTQPDAEQWEWKQKAGSGKPTQAGYKVCVADTEDEGVSIAHRLWANAGLPGELSQVLPSPKHFEQASELVTEDMTRHSPHYREFFRLYTDQVLPCLRG